MSQYGLILRKPKKPAAQDSSLFEDEDEPKQRSDKDDKPATKKKALESTEQLQKKALEEDPTIFDYDSYVDSKKKTKLLETDTKPKYMHDIMKRAAERRLDRELMQEKRLQKEMDRDKEIVPNKEMFVTSAYRAKLEEREKLKREMQKQDNEDSKDMAGFYKGMLEKLK